MSETDKVFAGSIPDIYDEILVPLIFEVYAEDLARRVAAGDPRAVLETAAGTGVVARALAPKLAASTRYVVTDLNRPMLDRAARMQKEDARIEWRVANALDLPFDNNSFDVVCCQFGVMFLPDRIAGYKEARRVLRPGGRFIFNTWDEIAENEFADVVTRVAGKVFPDDPPIFLARTPHGYHHVEKILSDVRDAGFEDVSVETVANTSTAPTARDPAVAYCEGTPLRNEIEARDPALLGEIIDRAASAISARFGKGPVSGRIQAHVVTAIA